MKETISIEWCWEDVKNVCEHLTKEQCCEVLQHVARYHDSGEGINWDVLINAADFLYPYQREDEE